MVWLTYSYYLDLLPASIYRALLEMAPLSRSLIALCPVWCLPRNGPVLDPNLRIHPTPSQTTHNQPTLWTPRAREACWPPLLPERTLESLLHRPLRPITNSTMATELWASYKQWADVQEDALLTWLDPSQGYKLSPMKDYPLMDFASAFAVCVAYLAFVVVGTLVMKAGVPAIKTSAVQFVYNPLQVVLCSYMCVEAGIQAYRNVSPLVFTVTRFSYCIGQCTDTRRRASLSSCNRATRRCRATRSTMRTRSWATCSTCSTSPRCSTSSTRSSSSSARSGTSSRCSTCTTT